MLLRRLFAPLVVLAVCSLPACNSTGSGVSMAGSNTGVFRTSSASASAAAAASTAGLRQPRGLRGLRGPRAYRSSASIPGHLDVRRFRRGNAGAAANLAARTAAGQNGTAATVNGTTGAATLNVGTRQMSWSPSDRTIFIGAPGSASLYGTQPASRYPLYDPTSNTWSWQ